MITIVDCITLILSLAAITISVVTACIQEKRAKLENRPDCRIKAFSLGDTLRIVLENVGAGVMMVEKITYSVSGNSEGDNANLSGFFYGVPCKTRSEARLNGDHLFPNSKHNLLTCAFETQSDLLAAWEIIKTLRVKIEYVDVYRKKTSIEKTLESDYKTFFDALGDDRILEAFKGRDWS